MAKDRWKPHTWGRERKQDILTDIEIIEGAARQLRQDVVRNSINLDLTYDKLALTVEGLYGKLDIHNLAIDNKMRKG